MVCVLTGWLGCVLMSTEMCMLVHVLTFIYKSTYIYIYIYMGVIGIDFEAVRIEGTCNVYHIVSHPDLICSLPAATCRIRCWCNLIDCSFIRMSDVWRCCNKLIICMTNVLRLKSLGTRLSNSNESRSSGLQFDLDISNVKIEYRYKCCFAAQTEQHGWLYVN